VRVTAQLSSATDGAVLWAEESAGVSADDFASKLPTMAASIAARLGGRLLPGERSQLERRGAINSEAYQDFLRGRAELLRNSVDLGYAPAKAVAHFQAALRLDPGFADAWAALAFAQQGEFGLGKGGAELLATAMDNARHALSIDPDNILARRALIRIYHSTGQDEDMLREAKRVLEINPADPDAQAAAALAYFRTGMLDRAMDLYERYLAAYPDDQDGWFQLVHACLFAKAYDRGLRHARPHVAIQHLLFPTYLLYANSGAISRAVPLARQQIALDQSQIAPGYFSALVLDSAGFHEEAASAWTGAIRKIEAGLLHADNERKRAFLAMMYARLNQPDTAREQLARAHELKPGDPWLSFFSSETYALLGDRAAALAALRGSVAAGFLGVHYLHYYQEAPNGWHRFRNDPEYVQIRTGLEHKIAVLRTRY
jgi:tetratricopeptide (TPR) repeat protein